MAKKKRRTTTPQEDFEKMVPDAQLRQQMFDHLQSGDRILGEGSPFALLLQGAINSMLSAEVDHHIASESAFDVQNKRNGYSTKTVTSGVGKLDISTPRDRNGSFNPLIVGKRERTLSSGIDEQIIALYAQGNSIEDVRRLVKQLYSVEISAGHISAITEKVWEDLQAWRTRSLNEAYAVIYLDAVYFKVRGQGGSRGKGSSFGTRASYTVYAIDFDGNRDILGIYVLESEGAKSWGRVLEDLRSRGVEEVFCFCIDGLKGFAESIREVFANSTVQRCIVHQLRQTTRFVSDRHVKVVRSDLRKVYTSATLEAANAAMEVFESKWDKQYSSISESWRENWDDLFAYLAQEFDADLRRMVYTTNPVEAVHRILRKLIKGKAAWTSETALIKQLYLSLMHNTKSWKRKALGWKAVQRAFVKYEGGYWAKYLPNG